jgi:hypothetical protein
VRHRRARSPHVPTHRAAQRQPGGRHPAVTRRRRRRGGTAPAGSPACRWFARRSWCSRKIHLCRCSRSSIRYRSTAPDCPGNGHRPRANGGRVLTQSSILHHRRRISSHHAHQKDSSHDPACNETCNEIYITNRANKPGCRWVARQVSRISGRPRQDSNLRSRLRRPGRLVVMGRNAQLC